VTFGCLLPSRLSLATLLCMPSECPYGSPHKRPGNTSGGTASACRCSRLVLEVAQYCRGEGTEGARGGKERGWRLRGRVLERLIGIIWDVCGRYDWGVAERKRGDGGKGKVRSGVRWGESLRFVGWLPDNTHMLPVRCVSYQQQKCCFGLWSLPAYLSRMLCSSMHWRGQWPTCGVEWHVSVTI